MLQTTPPYIAGGNTKSFAARVRAMQRGISSTDALAQYEYGYGAASASQNGTQPAAEAAVTPAASTGAAHSTSQPTEDSSLTTASAALDAAVAKTNEAFADALASAGDAHNALVDALKANTSTATAPADATAKPADHPQPFPSALVKEPEPIWKLVDGWTDSEIASLETLTNTDPSKKQDASTVSTVLDKKQSFTFAMDEDASPENAVEAMSCDLLSMEQRETSDQLAEEARQMQKKAAEAVARRWTRLKKDAKVECKADGSRSAVAVIIAADIRLPPVSLPQEWLDAVAHRHRGGYHDACNRTRSEVLAGLNQFTTGSDLFIHTDSAYADEVKLFKSLVAVRYTSEDGGNSATENVGNRGGAYVQWWRLRKAWQLMVEYENLCSHKYSFVMKIRTDMNLIGERSLMELYAGPIQSYDQDRTAFLSSDRFFGGSRSAMDHMTKFESAWGTYTNQGVQGLCGDCDYLQGVYATAGVTPACYEVAMEPKSAKCNSGCFTDAVDGRSICTVYQSEGFQIKGTPERKVMLGTKPREGNQFRLNAKSGLACTHGTGSSEKTFLYHVLSGNFTVASFSELDSELWSHQHADLMVWRHLVHVYANGFTIEDGPLHSAEEYGSELKWVQMEMLARETAGNGSMIACFNASQTRDERAANFYSYQEDYHNTAAFLARTTASLEMEKRYASAHNGTTFDPEPGADWGIDIPKPKRKPSEKRKFKQQRATALAQLKKHVKEKNKRSGRL